jgi:hypothetical protein
MVVVAIFSMKPVNISTALRPFFLLCVFALVSSCTYAQVSLRLQVRNASGQPVTAGIEIAGQMVNGNTSGEATITLNPGVHQLIISAAAYDTLRRTLEINGDTTFSFTLQPRLKVQEAVTVIASQLLTANQMSRQSLNIGQLRKLPVLLGEIDPLKSITLLPGIKSGGEASAGIYVRGGGPDQNLVLLDGVPVYNPNHLLGFFSIFNGEAVKNTEVIKGGMPAEYGGRLSSVIAIDTREGNRQETHVSGGIGLISSRLSVETPIKKNKSSLIVSGRRTYIDQVAKPFARERIGGNGYFFYDLNARADYELNDRNKLDLVFYTGRDNFTFSNDNNGRNRVFNTNWGNTLAGLNWRQKINSRLQQTTSAVYNRFTLDSRFGFSTLSFLFSSGLKDYQLKTDWQWNVQPKIKLKWGAQYIWHRFRPGAGSVTAGVQEFKNLIQDQYAREAAAYFSVDYDVTEKLNIVAGMRYSYFNQVGPTEKKQFGPDGALIDTPQIFGKGESVARYHYPEPRLNVLYQINNQSSLKLSYTQTVQYLHLATTSGATFPSDLWVPSSQLIKPGKAQQVAAGYFRSFKKGQYEMSAEAYYKTLDRQLEFRPGAQLLLNQNLEGEMIFGTGIAYGLELFMQKKTGRLTGWVGYTISRSERTFPELNGGKPFTYRYDRTHDMSVVANYALSKKWEFSGVFVYGTGNALTLPGARFTYNLGVNTATGEPRFSIINQYDQINGYRMPAYHRLDVAFIYTRKPDSKKRFKSSWNFGVYNVYNRKNPFFIYLDADQDTQTVKGKMVYLFPIVPSVTWNFKW